MSMCVHDICGPSLQTKASPVKLETGERMLGVGSSYITYISSVHHKENEVPT